MTPDASSASTDAIVVDASAVVEALLGTTVGTAVRGRMRGRALHAPAHLDAEILSALGRLHRAGDISAPVVEVALSQLAQAPIRRHPLLSLLAGAFARRERLRLADALYAELADTLGSLPLVSTDARLARALELVELVTAPSRH